MGMAKGTKEKSSAPGGATFLSCPLPFQRSTDSDGPDYVFQLDTITIGLRTIEESCPSDSSPLLWLHLWSFIHQLRTQLSTLILTSCRLLLHPAFQATMPMLVMALRNLCHCCSSSTSANTVLAYVVVLAIAACTVWVPVVVITKGHIGYYIS